MKKHLTRFLPLSRTTDDIHRAESKPCSAFARVQDHVEELRRFFGLPDEELFLDEFYCALSKRILLQGRMYIFEHFLCFYSNVFGWVKRKVIPLHLVKEITKKRNYGFHNSIEVSWRKQEFFTSFLNRNDAYELLSDAVKHAEPLSPSGNDGAQRESPPASSSASLSSRRSDPQCVKRSGKGGIEAGDEDSDFDGNDDEIDVWSVIPGPAPAVPENMALLCEDCFEVSVQQFFTRTLSMDSMFLDDYHKRRGDTRYRISEWEQLNEISGFVRQATFVSPVKGVKGIGFMSPKNTECNQDHRLCIYHEDHLVFQISQVMKDIPYGDNFSVEIRWDVTPGPDSNSCRIEIHVAVPFIRSVLAPFRSMIESNVMKEMQASVKIMTEMLRDTLSCPPPPESIDSEVDASEDGECDNRRTAQVLLKLRSLLKKEEGLQRLENLIGTTEPPGKNTASAELPPLHPIPPHQTTMHFESSMSPATNWTLFYCCLFVLFCQVLLALMWMATPYSPPSALPLQVEGLDQSLKQLRDVEVLLVSVLQSLNTSLWEVTPQS